MLDFYTALGSHFAALAHLSLFWGTLGFSIALLVKTARAALTAKSGNRQKAA